MAITLRRGCPNEDATARGVRAVARLLIVVVPLVVPTGSCGGEIRSAPTPSRDDDAGREAASADAPHAFTDAAEAVPSADAGPAPLCTPVAPDAGWAFCSLGEDYYVCDVMFDDYPRALQGACAPEGIECSNGCAAICNCADGEWKCFIPPCFR